MAAVAIAAVIAVIAALVWWTSDARATISQPAEHAVPDPEPAAVVPSALRELWSAASPKTRLPVVVGGSVVSGNGSTVQGRDPATGETVWLSHYTMRKMASDPSFNRLDVAVAGLVESLVQKYPGVPPKPAAADEPSPPKPDEGG